MRKRRCEKTNLTRMLLAIVTVFVVTQTPCAFIRIVVFVKGPRYFDCRHSLQVLSTLANFLTAINCAANFALYFLSHSLFKNEVRQRILLVTKRCRRKVKQEEDATNFLPIGPIIKVQPGVCELKEKQRSTL